MHLPFHWFLTYHFMFSWNNNFHAPFNIYCFSFVNDCSFNYSLNQSVLLSYLNLITHACTPKFHLLSFIALFFSFSYIFHSTIYCYLLLYYLLCSYQFSIYKWDSALYCHSMHLMYVSLSNPLFHVISQSLLLTQTCPVFVYPPALARLSFSTYFLQASIVNCVLCPGS